MRRLLLISLATISLTGCQFFNREDIAVIAPLSPTAEGDAAAETFAEPTVESQPTAVASTDLIRSTDPDARARQVNRNRVDPFASLPIPPAPDLVVIPPGEAAGNGTVAINGGGGGSSSNTSASASASAARGTSGGSASGASVPTVRLATAPLPPPVRVQPNNAPLVNPIAALPVIPRPVIAPTISVSGVIQMGDESYAIVRTGSEPERYVRVGDRLGGGTVRVKRIETLAFEPRVILEENGIEVARPISSEPAAGPSSEPAGEPVAEAPVPAAATGTQATIPTLSLPRILALPSPAG
ncbi:MAG: hypothetical protein WBB01_05110 [Phormidesmis sp.]